MARNEHLLPEYFQRGNTVSGSTEQLTSCRKVIHFLRDLPAFKRHYFRRENLVVSQPKEGIQCHAERKNWLSRSSPSYEC